MAWATLTTRRALVLALMAAIGLALLATAGTAQASSIVFVRGGDVWLSTPNHSREHRVTTTGGFSDVTQADDGTIVAGKGSLLYRMDPNGRALNAPFGVGAVPIGIDLSPDGTKVAYFALDSCDGSLCSQVHITDSNRGSSPTQYAYPEGNSPAWLSNERLMYTSSNSYVYTTGVAQGTGAEWFAESEQTSDGDTYILRAPAITRAHDKLLVHQRPFLGGSSRLVFYSMNGEPPAAPTARCVQDFGATEPKRPTWSPDGSAYAWEEGDGVHVSGAPDLGVCAQTPERTIAGATSPDWGPADVPVAQTDTDTDTGGSAKKCVVPKLKGKKLAKAKKALKKARCTLGKVKKARSRKKAGTVIKQRVKAGKRMPAGTKVGVTVARRR